MTSVGDFADLFDGCRTHREANDAYKEGLQVLSEALRQAHVRIVTVRDGPGCAVVKRTAPEASEAALKRSYDTIVRQWATMEGIPFRRVNKRLREQYEEDHRG